MKVEAVSEERKRDGRNQRTEVMWKKMGDRCVHEGRRSQREDEEDRVAPQPLGNVRGERPTVKI